jgi:hypothetical protein
MDKRSLDSMLARIGSELIPRGRQGLERRIPVNLLEVLALTADLVKGLGLPVREAFVLARSMTAGAGLPSATATTDGSPESDHALEPIVAVGEFASLQVDRQALRGEIEQRLAAAIESVVRPRRGRPRRRE